MPLLSVVGCKRDAVLWPAIGTNRDGEYVVGNPEAIKVRWEDGDRETTDPKGNTIIINAGAIVDRDIPMGSKMALGKLADWEALGTAPVSLPGKILRVVSHKEVTDPEERETFRVVGLQRFKDKLPTS